MNVPFTKNFSYIGPSFRWDFSTHIIIKISSLTCRYKQKLLFSNDSFGYSFKVINRCHHITLFWCCWHPFSQWHVCQSAVELTVSADRFPLHAVGFGWFAYLGWKWRDLPGRWHHIKKADCGHDCLTRKHDKYLQLLACSLHRPPVAYMVTDWCWGRNLSYS